MRDQRSKIDGDRRLFHSSQEFRNIRRRCATVTGHKCGHTHANEILSGGERVDRRYVRVDIDKTGSQYLAVCIDRLSCLCCIDAADARDATIVDCYVSLLPGVTATVDDAGIF